jgi:hypothetical protein
MAIENGDGNINLFICWPNVHERDIDICSDKLLASENMIRPAMFANTNNVSGAYY